MSELANLKPTIRLSIMNPDSESGSLFGRGIANLCLGVRETGSLNASAKGMGMAYSKAWRIVKDTEAALGIQLLDRDGAHGSTLTEAGDKLLDAYVAIDKKLQEDAEKEFARILGSREAPRMLSRGGDRGRQRAPRGACPEGSRAAASRGSRALRTC